MRKSAPNERNSDAEFTPVADFRSLCAEFIQKMSADFRIRGPYSAVDDFSHEKLENRAASLSIFGIVSHMGLSN